MDDHPLDRAIWNSLATVHASFALGCGRARRYPADVSPLAGVIDADPESLAALSRLIRETGMAVVAQAAEIEAPPGTAPVWQRDCHQMVFAGAVPPDADDPRIEPLSAADAAEMLRLAQLTKPGPFAARTQSMGRYWGIRHDGRLIAMAGERLHQTGFTEISGVSTHPDHRRKGLARALSLHACREILRAGETPYLHAFADNETAIGLYATLGFRRRATLPVTALAPA